MGRRGKVKAISYSLFGDAECYTRGVIENCERALRIYPGWTVMVWSDGSTSGDVLQRCADLGAEIRVVDPANPDCRFLRFRAAAEAEIFISRDADCRLSRREAEAVEEWLQSGRPFHLMHDHYWHNVPVMAGMWGARSPALPDGFLDAAGAPQPGCSDQAFLERQLWDGLLAARPELYLNHRGNGWRSGHSVPFPSPRWGKQFVGDTFLRESHLDSIERPTT